MVAMEKKLFLRAIIRGWLPKDQSFQNIACETKKPTKINQSPKNNENEDRPMTKGQIRALTVLGIANIIMLISYSSYLVIYLITPSLWSSTLGFSLWVFIVFSLLFVNFLLYMNYKRQTRMAEGV